MFFPHVLIYLECQKNTYPNPYPYANLRCAWYCVGHYGNKMLRLCSLICALSVNHS